MDAGDGLALQTLRAFAETCLDCGPGDLVSEDGDHRRRTGCHSCPRPLGKSREAGLPRCRIEHKNDGALQVGAGELIDVLLAKDGAVADEDHGRVAQLLGRLPADKNEIVVVHGHRLATGAPDRAMPGRPALDEPDGLVPAAIPRRRLQPEPLQLSRDVEQGFVLTLGTRLAALVGVACKHLDVATHLLRRHVGCSGGPLGLAGSREGEKKRRGREHQSGDHGPA
jgi:hypothetical protein